MARKVNIATKQSGNDANSRITPGEINEMVEVINANADDLIAQNETIGGLAGGYQGDVTPAYNLDPTMSPPGIYTPLNAGSYGPTGNKFLVVPENPDVNGDSFIYQIINNGSTLALQSTKVPIGNLATKGDVQNVASNVSSLEVSVSAIANEITNKEIFGYTGVRPYRYYLAQDSYVETASAISQQNNDTFDVFTKAGGGNTISSYFSTGIVYNRDKVLRIDATILSTETISVGIGFFDGTDMYGYALRSSDGVLLKTSPFTTSSIASPGVLFGQNDVITFEVSQGTIRVYKNGTLIVTVTGQLPAGTVQLVFRGGVISMRVNKAYYFTANFAAASSVNALTSVVNANYPFKRDATFMNGSNSYAWQRQFIKDIKLYGFPMTDRISLFLVRRNSTNANKWQLDFYRDTGDGSGNSATRQLVMNWTNPNYVEPASGEIAVIEHTQGNYGFKAYLDWTKVPAADNGSMNYNSVGFAPEVYINFNRSSIVPQPTADARLLWRHSNEDVPVTGTDVYQKFTVVPNRDTDNAIVGCTGASLNTRTGEYVISYYSYAKTSELWLFKPKDLVPYSDIGTITPTPTRKISLHGLIYHVQGNCYDSETNTYWVSGTNQPESSGTARCIIRVDDDGNLIERYDFTAYNFEMGMIALSPDLKNILIKPNNQAWILEIDKVTKQQVRQVNTNANEGLGVDYQNGFVYTASDAGVLYKRNYSDMSIVAQYNFQTLPNSPSTNQNVEGIIVLPNEVVLIVFDAFLHGLNNNGNAMFVYDLNKTLRKYLSFPEMFQLVNGLSSVFDFGANRSLLPVEILSGNGSVQYRGSNTAPTFVSVARLNMYDVPYYADWGTTTPSDWSDTVPDYRYMQIRMT